MPRTRRVVKKRRPSVIWTDNEFDNVSENKITCHVLTFQAKNVFSATEIVSYHGNT